MVSVVFSNEIVLIRSGSISSCGIAGVGVALLEEVCDSGGGL